MRRIVVLACGLLMFATAGMAQGGNPSPEEATKIKEGAQAPAFTATMLDGTTVDSQTLRGKVVLLNFWATWCPPCRQEFTRVQADIVDRYADREFVLLALSRGEDKATVEKFMKKQGYAFPVGVDTRSEVYDKFAITYIPRNFVIDKEGVVRFVSVGYAPADFEKMLARIDALLDE